jgi:hypothetical protein
MQCATSSHSCHMVCVGIRGTPGVCFWCIFACHQFKSMYRLSNIILQVIDIPLCSTAVRHRWPLQQAHHCQILRPTVKALPNTLGPLLLLESESPFWTEPARKDCSIHEIIKPLFPPFATCRDVSAHITKSQDLISINIDLSQEIDVSK